MKGDEIDAQLAVDSAPALIFGARPDGYVDYFNHRWFDHLGGVPLQELEGWGWTRWIHPDDLEEHLRRWRAAMANGRAPISEARVCDASGEYCWMLHRTEPIRDPAGRIIRWFGTSIDIQELKRAQHESVNCGRSRPRHRGHQPRSGPGHRREHVPAGSVLPPQRVSDRASAAA